MIHCHVSLFIKTVGNTNNKLPVRPLKFVAQKPLEFSPQRDTYDFLVWISLSYGLSQIM